MIKETRERDSGCCSQKLLIKLTLPPAQTCSIHPRLLQHTAGQISLQNFKSGMQIYQKLKTIYSRSFQIVPFFCVLHSSSPNLLNPVSDLDCWNLFPHKLSFFCIFSCFLPFPMARQSFQRLVFFPSPLLHLLLLTSSPREPTHMQSFHIILSVTSSMMMDSKSLHKAVRVCEILQSLS